MILDDEDAVTRDAKARHRARPFSARDRFTVDKNAPERRRAIRWDLLDDDDQDETDEGHPGLEFDPVALAEAVAAGDAEDVPRGHLFADIDGPAPGDPALHDPQEAMAALGSPLAYAQHAMLLSESFRQACGAGRAEAIAYLAELFIALPDRDFARSALRELGLSTGIIDIYPLEAIVHILESAPHFLSRTEFGPVVERLGFQEGVLVMEPFRAGTLRVLPDRVIRGFALAGGPRPGYRFEPALKERQYRLVFGAPGRFEILVSARTPSGTMVDRFRVDVAGEAPEALPPDDPLPDHARLARWPRPKPRPPSRAPSAPRDEGLHLSIGERWSRAEQDALRGPKGEEAFSSAPAHAEHPSDAEAQAEPAAPLTRTDLPSAPTASPSPAGKGSRRGSEATDVDVPAVPEDPEDTQERFEAAPRPPSDVTEPDVPAVVSRTGSDEDEEEGSMFEPTVAPPPLFYRTPPAPVPPRRSAPLVGEDDTDDLPG